MERPAGEPHLRLVRRLWGVKSKPTPYGASILTNTTSVFHNPTWYAFTLAGLLGAFTLVGFELAADMSEDAVDPRRSVARGVLWAVIGSVVLGMVALIGFTLAIPDLKTVEEAPLPLLAIAMVYGYNQPSSFGTLVGATAIIPYIIYFLITLAYALLRRLRNGTAGVKPASELVDKP